MNNTELHEILRKHRMWLQGEAGGERANLRGADLRGAYLRGANLSSANLRGANLWGANLRGANLWGAYLEGAYLEDAALEGADLEGVDLRRANLRGANLSHANLNSVDLRRANLRSANLIGANLRGADLRGADLSDANLRSANLIGTKFELTGQALIVEDSSDVFYFYLVSKHEVLAVKDYVKIGCEEHHIDYWLEHFEEIGKRSNYSEAAIEEYEEYLAFLKVRRDRLNGTK